MTLPGWGTTGAPLELRGWEGRVGLERRVEQQRPRGVGAELGMPRSGTAWSPSRSTAIGAAVVQDGGEAHGAERYVDTVRRGDR